MLTLDKLTEKIHTASITKKAISDMQVTPLHFACVNPNIEVLKTLLDQSDQINVMDAMSAKPIHFAAVNQSPEALKLLIEKGANIFDQDNLKKTALHYATIMGRVEIIKFILENQPRLAKVRDRKGYTAMAYACERNEIATIEAFLDSKIVKVGAGQG